MSMLLPPLHVHCLVVGLDVKKSRRKIKIKRLSDHLPPTAPTMTIVVNVAE